MATDTTLSDIALGHVAPEQALSALAEMLGSDEPKAAQQTYVALRAWVWKALDARRRDPELRAWFDVLRRTAAFLKQRDAALAERIAALHELIQESINVSERVSVDDIVRKRHVKQILGMLSAEADERLDRSVIGDRTGLKQGNLTRVLNMMTDAGLAERAANGKHAEFQLTREGRGVADRLNLRMPEEAKVAEAVVLVHRDGKRHRIRPRFSEPSRPASASIGLYRPKDPVVSPKQMQFGAPKDARQGRALKARFKGDVFASPTPQESSVNEAPAAAPTEKPRRRNFTSMEA